MRTTLTPIAILLVLLGSIVVPMSGAAPSIHPGGIIDETGDARSDTNGGQVVTICGTGFVAGSRVFFGGEEGAVLDVLTSTPAATWLPCGFTSGTVSTINVTAPAHGAGKVNVVVLNPDGTTSTASMGYEYVAAAAPAITKVTVASPTTNGGPKVTIEGSGFHGGRNPISLVIGAAKPVVTGYTSTKIEATLPAHFTGSLGVRLTNPDGQQAIATAQIAVVTAPAPAITSVAVTAVDGKIFSNNAFQNTITIKGTGFDPFVPGTDEFGSIVKIGGRVASVVPGSNKTTIFAVLPSLPAGSYTVSVINPDGQLAVSSGSITVTADDSPTGLADLAPVMGPAVGGFLFSIDGTAFSLGHDGSPPAVLFGGAPATGVTLSGSTLTGTAPAHAAGVVEVKVINPDGASTVLPAAFTYVETALPLFTQDAAMVSPAQGSENGGTVVTVRGEGFRPGAQVFMGDATGAMWPVGTATVASDGRSLTFTSSQDVRDPLVSSVIAPVLGLVDIVIVQPDGEHITIVDGFRFTAAAPPTFTKISPISGPNSGGTIVTITGDNFASGAIVTLDGIEAHNVQVLSKTTIRATAASRSGAGTGDVVVTNLGTQPAAVGTNAWTYAAAPAPVITSISPSTGSENGGLEITISGLNFITSDELGVFFTKGGVVDVPAVSVTPVGPNSLKAVVPPTPDGTIGAAQVFVQNGDQGRNAAAGTFTYVDRPTPTISSITKTESAASGGTVFRINGANFDPGVDVLFAVASGEIPAARVTRLSSTLLEVTAPAVLVGDIGAGKVRVLNAGGDKSSLASAPTFTFKTGIAPTISSVSPMGTDGSAERMVTILGTNFGVHALVDGAAAPGARVPTVNFGVGNPSPNVIARSSGEIVAEVPSGLTAGTLYGVQVVNPAGLSGVLNNAFQAQCPPPVITSLSTAGGSGHGGGLLTIFGSDFDFGVGSPCRGQGLAVLVGQQAGVVASQGTGSVTLNVPPGLGAVPVTVVRGDGQSSALRAAYTYDAQVAPTLASSADAATCMRHAMSVASGPAAGGTPITFEPSCGSASFAPGIAGAPFLMPAAMPTVTIGGTEAPVNRTVFGALPSTTAYHVMAPPLAAGLHDVVLTNPDGSSATLVGGWLALGATGATGPDITSISPVSGTALGGTVVVIGGINLSGVTQVTIGGAAATSVTVISPTQVSAVTPPGTAGTVDVTVGDGTATDTLAAAYTYVPADPPVLSSISKITGSSLGGTTVVLLGADFAPGAKVFFGDREAISVVRDASDQLTVVTPGHPAGAVDVRVQNPDGQSSTLAAAYTYTAALAPVVESIAPTVGPLAGGTAIVVKGRNFAVTPGVKVMIGGAEATSVAVVDSKTINAVTPAGTSGAKDVKVINPDDQNGTLAAAFTYRGTAGTGGGTVFDLEGANILMRLTGRVVVMANGTHAIIFDAKSIQPPLDGVLISAGKDANGKFHVIADLPRDSDAFQNGVYYIEDPDAATTAYLVTGYYGDLGRLALGADPSSSPGYAAIKDGLSVDGTGKSDKKDVPLWPILLLLLGVVSIIAMLIAVVLSARRGDREDGGYEWEDAEGDDAAGPVVAPQGTWDASAAEQTFPIECPHCAEQFTAVGATPLVTHCPGCGRKGILR